MKVLAVNSSARSGSESKTGLMLNHLVDGMKEAGADVESVNLREKNIKQCAGCFTCMTKTPGKCILRDDMTEDLFPQWQESDLVIYATPLFHHTVNAAMKTFIERTWPICEPFLVEREGRWFHPLRRKHPGVVVLSVCGFPAMSAFDGLSHYVKFLYEAQEKGILWGEIYRPGAEFMMYQNEKLNDILDATGQAGKELVKTHAVSRETRARIEQPLSDDIADFARIANCWWKTCIDEEITIKKFTEKFAKGEMIPRPDSIETFLLVQSIGFNPEAAGDTKATLQFEFSGNIEGTCYLQIADGRIKTGEGKSEKPDLVIRTPFELWMDIITGKADGTEMFLKGKYKAEGNTEFLDISKFFQR